MEIKKAMKRFEAFGVASGILQLGKGATNKTDDYFDSSIDIDIREDTTLEKITIALKKEHPVYFEMMPVTKEWISLMEDYENQKKIA